MTYEYIYNFLSKNKENVCRCVLHRIAIFTIFTVEQGSESIIGEADSC